MNLRVWDYGGRETRNGGLVVVLKNQLERSAAKQVESGVLNYLRSLKKESSTPFFGSLAMVFTSPFDNGSMRLRVDLDTVNVSIYPDSNLKSPPVPITDREAIKQSLTSVNEICAVHVTPQVFFFY